jgi:hypothetical protein
LRIDRGIDFVDLGADLSLQRFEIVVIFHSTIVEYADENDTGITNR